MGRLGHSGVVGGQRRVRRTMGHRLAVRWNEVGCSLGCHYEGTRGGSTGSRSVMGNGG